METADCPFCKSHLTGLDRFDSIKSVCYFVRCGTCEAQGPVEQTAEEAIKAWDINHGEK